MSVILINNIGAVIGYNGILSANRQVAELLVTALIHREADCRVEMMIDVQEPGVELTRSQLIKTLQLVKSDVAVSIAEMMSALQHEMEQALASAEPSIVINSLKFDSEGEVYDVDADLTVSYPEK